MGCLGRWGRQVSDEEPVGHQRVDVGMEVEVFAKGVEGENNGRDALRTVQGGAQVRGQAFLGQGTEPLEQAAMVLKVGTEHSGEGQDIVPMGYWSQDAVEDEAGGGLNVFLVAGGAKPSGFAGEGQQIFVMAMVAADASKTSGQVPTLQEFVDHLGDNRAQAAEAGLVFIGVDLLELVVVAVGALPERRFFWVAGTIGLHI